jgi:hypothetical protein
MTSLVNVTNDYIAGAHRFYTIGSGTSNDNLTNFSIQPKYETVRIQDSNVFITGSIYPTSCNVYDIGSSNYRWRDLYLSGNTIDLGGTRISRNNATGGMKISSKVNDAPLDFTAQHITALGTLYASNITIAGNALIIGDNGNVGMGTALPTQKLDVRGNIYASGNIVCSNISVIGDFVRLDTITSNTEQMVVENAGTGPALKVTQSGANSVAEFYDKESGVALFVGNGGNIGIGTNAPLAKLHVNDTGAMIIPSGTTAQQPTVSIAGMLRFNIDNGTPEFYSPIATAWIPLVKAPSFLIEYLVIAGGGGGGMNAGAGGGAGGYRTNRIGDSSGGGGATESPFYGIIGTAYTLAVGTGGQGGTTSSVDTTGTNGNNSVFSTITSIGGGAGTNSGGVGAAGGSGGGAGNYESGTKAGGAGTTGQGFRGGNGTIPGGGGRTGAGGGGAGAIGQDSQTTTLAGNGGIGVVSTITGSSIYRGGGGGGGVHSGTGGSGGNGGGGGEGQVGTVNTGGGGGAGRSPNAGSAGGSGVIILRVSSIYLATFSAGLTYTEVQLGNSKVYNITAGSGTINFY